MLENLALANDIKDPLLSRRSCRWCSEKQDPQDLTLVRWIRKLKFMCRQEEYGPRYWKVPLSRDTRRPLCAPLLGVHVSFSTAQTQANQMLAAAMLAQAVPRENRCAPRRGDRGRPSRTTRKRRRRDRRARKEEGETLNQRRKRKRPGEEN